MVDSAILLGLCIIIFILIVYIYIKDKNMEQKFTRFDTIITEHINEFFLIKKESAQLKEMIEETAKNKDEALEELVENKLEPILNSLKNINEMVKNNISTTSDEEAIIREYRTGLSIEQIAASRGMSSSRVEFILKFNKVI